MINSPIALRCVGLDVGRRASANIIKTYEVVGYTKNATSYRKSA